MYGPACYLVLDVQLLVRRYVFGCDARMVLVGGFWCVRVRCAEGITDTEGAETILEWLFLVPRVPRILVAENPW